MPIDEASETWLEAALNSWLLVFATALLHGVVIYVLWNDYTSAGLVNALAAYTISMGILTFLLAEHLKKVCSYPWGDKVISCPALVAWGNNSY